MTDDRMIADLLGETPKGPQPGFRVDVFARMAMRARHRAARRRAAMQAGLFTLIGLAFPLAHAFGATMENTAPVFLAALTLAAAALIADATLNGPKTAAARVRTLLAV